MSTPIPNPNSIAVKVVKSTGTETESTSKPAKFPFMAKDETPGATRVSSLHPKVQKEIDAKQQKTVEVVKVEPKALLIPKENGTFEIQVTCSCGEVHTIECEPI